MSKQSKRRRLAEIVAKATEHPIVCTGIGVDWIQAKEGEGQDSPKKFSMTAYTGGPMIVGYYYEPVVIDLTGLKADAKTPILLNHDSTKIVGHSESVEIGDSSLKLSGVISGTGESAGEVTGSAKNGFPWKASVGVRPDKMEFVGEGVSTIVNGKTLKGPLYVARKSSLGEVSFVAVAADSKTSAKVAASAAQTKGLSKMDKEFLAWLEASGLDAATLTDESKAALEATWKKANSPVKAAADPVKPIEGAAPDPIKAMEEEMRIKAAAELKRQADIIRICAANPADDADQAKAVADIQAKAISEGWTVEKTELAELKARLPKGPAIHSSSREVNQPAIEAAFSLSCGLREPEKHYKPEVLEAANRNHRGMGLQELLLIQAQANGYSGRMSITQANLREVIRAAFSTHTITTLLTTAGNKVLLDGFNSIPQTWREVAAVRTVSDFKSVTAFRLTAGLEYEEVGSASEIKHGTLGQESYTRQAKTYAKMLVLTRADIINDDLGAFNDLRTRLGLGSTIKMNKVFWTLYLASSNTGTFWSATNGNLVTSSALAEAGLNNAVKAFRDMAGPDGNMMNLTPTKVLVPTALEATAKKLYVSQEVRDTTSSTKFQTANIYQNAFRPVPIPELGNSAYTGYSATTWYLHCDPNVLASFEMCFLDGQESPTIESAEADFDTLGIQLRGYHDFGCNESEYRASVKATA